MVYWKSSTTKTKHGSPFAPASAAQPSGSTLRSTPPQEESEVTYEMTALEITVLVITFLAFVGQFVNLYFAIVDHQKISKFVKSQSL